MTEYRVTARRIDSHGSLAVAKEAEVSLDTAMAGRRDAMNPVELLLSALAACIHRQLIELDSLKGQLVRVNKGG